MTLLDIALTWSDHGYAPLPLKIDGSKAPWVDKWTDFIDNPPTRDDVQAIFTRQRRTEGIGVLCGKPSAGLEMFELEGRAVTAGLLDELATLLADNGFGDLWERINGGYVELTPGGGMHWYYRVDGEAMGNTKLASDEKHNVLIETRGQGGFTIIAPSGGKSHESGGSWTTLRGTIDDIAVITTDERDALYAISAMLDRSPVINEPPKTKNSPNLYGGTRPGDDFNQRADWADILTGWKKVRSFGGRCYGWRRPGKNIGISATTGRNDGDNLYVFTTSTEFEDLRAYSKFAAYTLLNHHGDYSAAAKDLSRLGYGSPPPVTTTPETRHLSLVEGTSALAVQEHTEGLPADAYGPTEDGTARLLVARHAHELRYCPQRGRWLTWNGHRWVWDEREHHRELVRIIARDLPEDAGWPAYKKRALSASGVTGITRHAQSDPKVVVHIDDLDARPYELNTPGGIIDLRTGTLRTPDPAALHTRTTTATPDFETPSDILDTFLADTFPDDTLRAYVARLLGLSAIGAVLENILPFGYGIGANGKTTLYEACAHALGTGETGYAISAPSEMLMQRKHAEHPAELAQLAGARLVVCSELDDGQKFAEARVKMLTGADSINARFMRRDPFTFKPSHTLHLLGNHKPSAATGGPAFWRRVQLIPFDHVVPENQRDSMLGEKLADNAGAVLAWLARGAADYIKNGLRIPSIVRGATDDYAADQDTVGRFVNDECHQSSSDMIRVKTGVLRAGYERWCIEMGETPVSAKRLTADLTERFDIGSHRSNGVRFYTRIALNEDEETGTDSARSQLEDWWKK